jgi:transposase
VAPLEEIRDVETLRQVALLLQKENARLHERLERLIREVAELRGEGNPQQFLALEIEKLQEQMAQLQKRIFAASSERRAKPEEEAKAEDSAPQRGHGPREQERLPIQEVPHELPPEERKCPVCAGEMSEWAGQTEDSEEITVVERSFVVVKHRRKKYRCRCNASVVTAPAPPKLIEGGRYSVDFAVAVAAAKYLDHLPLDRQAGMMEREGLTVETQTLWDQTNALARHLHPTYEALVAKVRGSPIVGADETWWRLLKPGEAKRWWNWCLASPEAVVYRLLDSRSTEAARQILGDYRGIVMADGYSVYRSLQGAEVSFTLAHCWAHVRRKFVEAESFFPRECAEALDLIGELYRIEGEIPALPGLERADREEVLELRARVRAEKSRPVVDRIRDWAYAQRCTPESSLRKAIDYMLSLWEGLKRFLDDPRVPLDNNAVERALRGPVVGRKNYYGSRSKRGAEVAAIFYSLFETAKLCGLNPKGYLREAAWAAVEKPGTVLLPHDLLTQAEPPVAATG